MKRRDRSSSEPDIDLRDDRFDPPHGTSTTTDDARGPDDLDNPFSSGAPAPAPRTEPAPSRAGRPPGPDAQLGSPQTGGGLDLADVDEPTMPSPRPVPTGRRVADRPPSGFLSARRRRSQPESILVRLIATAGVIAIGTALAAILGLGDVPTWVVGLVCSVVTVVLAAVLWRSRRL
jgi:hypothetical protein